MALFAGAAEAMPVLDKQGKLKNRKDRKFLCELLIGVLEKVRTVYPESDPDLPNSFWDGTNLGILYDAFPTYMAPLVDFLKDQNPDYRDDVLPMINVVGFAEGDGSWSGVMDGSRNMTLT